MATVTNPPAKASTQKTMFSRTTTVSVEINAYAAIVWQLLTGAPDYPRWCKTVIGIEGKIAPGETIQLKSTLDPKRVFKLKIKDFEVDKKLSWGDAMGSRVYTIQPTHQGEVILTITEKIGGPLFPLFAGMIPSFDASFEQFAADIKQEAETIMNLN